MVEMNEYIQILIDSLNRKCMLLDRILSVTEVQRGLATQEGPMDLDDFHDTMEQKDELIQELNTLDEGFMKVYDRVKGALTSDKARYAEHIKKMQQLIDKVTDKSVAVQTNESRNKLMIERKFSELRTEIKSFRTSNKAAIGYYQNMKKLNNVDSQFLDKKK